MKKVLVIVLVVAMVFAMVACAAPAAAPEAAAPAGEAAGQQAAPAAGGEGVPIKIGHLSYHTGPFAHAGTEFDAAANFALKVINENPPLGGAVTITHQDIGTIGEGEAAKLLLESENVDILLNVAGEYMSYRDWLLNYIANNGSPLLPSVHAGSVKSSYGGTVEEPIFRGAPQDPYEGIAAVQMLADQGIKSAVVIAVENDGMQLMQEAAVGACKEVGIEVLGEYDFEAEQSSYRSMVSKIQAQEPEAILCFCAATDGGTIVKNTAELGMSATFVSGTDWLSEEVAITAGQSSLDQHKGVYVVGFTYVEGEAWDYYLEKWNSYPEITDGFFPEYSYSLQYYDLLNVAMLAVKKAGSLEIPDWVAAMKDVSHEGEGKTVVYTYEQGIAALERGEDINYDGITGAFEYSETGVVSGNFGVYQWKTTDNLEFITQVDGTKVLDLSMKVGVS